MIVIILDCSILSFMYVIIAYLSSSRPLSIFGAEVHTTYMRYAKHSAFSSLGWMTEHTVWEYIYTNGGRSEQSDQRSESITYMNWGDFVDLTMAKHPSPHTTHAMTCGAAASQQSAPSAPTPRPPAKPPKPSRKPKGPEQEQPPAQFNLIFVNAGDLLDDLEDTPDTLVNEVSIPYD